MDSDWQDVFLKGLEQTGNVSAACRAAGVCRMTAYRHKANEPPFSERWDSALEVACDTLELEVRRRGLEGVERRKFHAGLPILVQVRDDQGRPLTDAAGLPVMTHYVEREYSDILLMFLLKAHRPKFRDLKLPPLEAILELLPPELAGPLRQALVRLLSGAGQAPGPAAGPGAGPAPVP